MRAQSSFLPAKYQAVMVTGIRRPGARGQRGAPGMENPPWRASCCRDEAATTLLSAMRKSGRREGLRSPLDQVAADATEEK